MSKQEQSTKDVTPVKATARDWGLAPWFADWFDFPELNRWFGARPALVPSTERIRIEEERRDDELVVRADMPGIDPDKDVEITVENGMLRIHAERRKEEREESNGRMRSEFHYGMFSRTIPLPAEATSDQVKATYKDGVLEVHVPMAKEAQPTRVAVARA